MQTASDTPPAAAGRFHPGQANGAVTPMSKGCERCNHTG
jgi:hypothetical protein